MKVDKWFHLYSRKFDVVFEEVSCPAPIEWIPVSEGLPDEETDVFICNANGDRAISRGSYSTEAKDDFIWYTSGWRFGKVVAWMPLPEPWKGEER